MCILPVLILGIKHMCILPMILLSIMYIRNVFIAYDAIQLLTFEVLDMTRYPPENTNIDRGDSRGEYWYSVVDISDISNTLIVNNCFVI